MSDFRSFNQINIPNDIQEIFSKHTLEEYDNIKNYEHIPIKNLIKGVKKGINDTAVTDDLIKFENNIINKYLTNIITIPKKSIEFNVIQTSIHILLNFFDKDDNINLIIGNRLNHITPLLHLNKHYKNVLTDISVFNSNHSSGIIEKENDVLDNLKSIKHIRKYYGHFNYPIDKFHDLSADLPKSTYDNIIIQYPTNPKQKTAINFYFVFPKLFAELILGLSCLKNEGNLYIYFELSYPLKSFKQMLDLIVRSFKYVMIEPLNNEMIGLKCQCYDNFYFLSLEKDYWKKIEKFDNYSYINNKLNIENIIEIYKDIFYDNSKFNMSEITLLTKTKKKSKTKSNSTSNSKSNTKSKSITKYKSKHLKKSEEFKILYMFDNIQPKIYTKTDNLIKIITTMFINYHTKLNHYINIYLPLSVQSLNDMFMKEVVVKFRNLIELLIDSNFMLGREYVNLSYQMQNNYLADVFILSNNISFEIIDYGKIQYKSKTKTKTKSISKSISKTKSLPTLGFNINNFLESAKSNNTKSMDYDTTLFSSISTTKKSKRYSFDKRYGFHNLLKHTDTTGHYYDIKPYYNRLETVNKLKQKYELDGTYKYNKDVTRLVEDFKGGIKVYLNDKFKLEYKMSNGFTKLWEIYHIFKLLPNKGTVRTFHFAEAPGQFIWATSRFLNKRLPGNNKHLWKANSLNPKNETVIKQYGNVFNDVYGFMRRNPDNWLWGEDDTGDIMKSKNLLWFRKELLKWSNGHQIDCLTGDGGLSSGSDIKLLQQLDYAQLCVVATCCFPGKHCVVKTFTPFINNTEQAVTSSRPYIGMFYIYKLLFRELHLFKPYSSDPTSGEFYIIGKGFLDLDKKYLDMLLERLDNYEEDQAFFSKNSIPDYFLKQYYKFIDTITYYNTRAIERHNFLTICLSGEENNENCKDYLKKSNIETIKDVRYKKWVEMFKFA